jgi:hypothetical protein
VTLRTHLRVGVGRRRQDRDVLLPQPCEQVGRVGGADHRQLERGLELLGLLACAERGRAADDQRHRERHHDQRHEQHAPVAERVEQLLVQHHPEHPHA